MNQKIQTLQRPAHTPKMHRLYLMMSMFIVSMFGFSASGQDYASMVSGLPSEPPVTIGIEAQNSQIVPGAKSVIAIILDHAEHYHTNLNVPIVPKEMGNLVPIPTTVTLPELEGLTFEGIIWPEPVEVDIDFLMTGNPYKYLVYSERAIIYIPFEVAAGSTIGEQVIELQVGYQACDETTCLAPESEIVSVTIDIVETVTDGSEPSSIFDGYDPDATPVLSTGVVSP